MRSESQRQRATSIGQLCSNFGANRERGEGNWLVNVGSYFYYFPGLALDLGINILRVLPFSLFPISSFQFFDLNTVRSTLSSSLMTLVYQIITTRSEGGRVVEGEGCLLVNGFEGFLCIFFDVFTVGSGLRRFYLY